jgi:hypothetical protein
VRREHPGEATEGAPLRGRLIAVIAWLVYVGLVSSALDQRGLLEPGAMSTSRVVLLFFSLVISFHPILCLVRGLWPARAWRRDPIQVSAGGWTWQAITLTGTIVGFATGDGTSSAMPNSGSGWSVRTRGGTRASAVTVGGRDGRINMSFREDPKSMAHGDRATVVHLRRKGSSGKDELVLLRDHTSGQSVAPLLGGLRVVSGKRTAWGVVWLLGTLYLTIWSLSGVFLKGDALQWFFIASVFWVPVVWGCWTILLRFRSRWFSRHGLRRLVGLLDERASVPPVPVRKAPTTVPPTPPTPQPLATPAAPAGWLVDPTGRHEHRYWDGIAWTAHVADEGEQETDPI